MAKKSRSNRNPNQTRRRVVKKDKKKKTKKIIPAKVGAKSTANITEVVAPSGARGGQGSYKTRTLSQRKKEQDKKFRQSRLFKLEQEKQKELEREIASLKEQSQRPRGISSRGQSISSAFPSSTTSDTEIKALREQLKKTNERLKGLEPKKDEKPKEKSKEEEKPKSELKEVRDTILQEGIKRRLAERDQIQKQKQLDEQQKRDEEKQRIEQSRIRVATRRLRDEKTAQTQSRIAEEERQQRITDKEKNERRKQERVRDRRLDDRERQKLINDTEKERKERFEKSKRELEEISKREQQEKQDRIRRKSPQQLQLEHITSARQEPSPTVRISKDLVDDIMGGKKDNRPSNVVSFESTDESDFEEDIDTDDEFEDVNEIDISDFDEDAPEIELTQEIIQQPRDVPSTPPKQKPQLIQETIRQFVDDVPPIPEDRPITQLEKDTLTAISGLRDTIRRTPPQEAQKQQTQRRSRNVIQQIEESKEKDEKQKQKSRRDKFLEEEKQQEERELQSRARKEVASEFTSSIIDDVLNVREQREQAISEIVSGATQKTLSSRIRDETLEQNRARRDNLLEQYNTAVREESRNPPPSGSGGRSGRGGRSGVPSQQAIGTIIGDIPERPETLLPPDIFRPIEKGKNKGQIKIPKEKEIKEIIKNYENNPQFRRSIQILKELRDTLSQANIKGKDKSRKKKK